MSPDPTHIGIAFYTLEKYPIQWVIILSPSEYFYGTFYGGTVIENVNGWEVSWRQCQSSPATFAPYTALLGIIKVGTINERPDKIINFTSTLPWNPQHFRNDGGGKKYPPTDEYVRQVIFHLCNHRTITLPPRVKVTFSTHIEERLSKMRETPQPKTHTYPIIPIGDADVPLDVDFVGWNAQYGCLEVTRVISSHTISPP
jgi:hypothetical protein